ncbi:MAG: TIGR04255 family protein [Pseudohongiellaceae bacterium]
MKKKRPDHLPDFENPPLDEVIIDLHFEPAPDYTIASAMDIRSLFLKEFPILQERVPLPPVFEIFKKMNTESDLDTQITNAPPLGSRLLFVSGDGSHLLQLQEDRFTANWLRGPSSTIYPRFESIATAWEKNLVKLNKYFSSKLNWPIKIDQAEISYHNVIEVEEFSQAGEWFSFWNTIPLDIKIMTAGFNEVIQDGEGEPYARLWYDMRPIYLADGKRKAFSLSLSFRGRPPEPTSLASAMEFISKGRESIVTRFSEITTDKAQEQWRKIK